MSYDLAIWKSPAPGLEPDDAYGALCEGRAEAVVADAGVGAFAAALREAFPPLSELAPEAVDESPWAADPEVGPGHVLLSISWSHAEAMHEHLERLALVHGLAIHVPEDEVGDVMHLDEEGPAAAASNELTDAVWADIQGALDREEDGEDLSAADAVVLTEAVRRIRAALEIRPGNEGALWILGCLCQRLGDAKAGLAAFEACIACGADDPQVFHRAAACAADAEEAGAALRLARRAVELDQDGDPELRAMLAAALAVSGQRQEARAAAKAALEIDAENPLALVIRTCLVDVEARRRKPPKSFADLGW